MRPIHILPRSKGRGVCPAAIESKQLTARFDRRPCYRKAQAFIRTRTLAGLTRPDRQDGGTKEGDLLKRGEVGYRHTRILICKQHMTRTHMLRRHRRSCLCRRSGSWPARRGTATPPHRHANFHLLPLLQCRWRAPTAPTSADRGKGVDKSSAMLPSSVLGE